MACMSMTGFGEGRASEDGVELVVEVKSVNHRFLDIVCRLPSLYSKFEIEVGKTVKTQLRRGRVEVSVQRSQQSKGEYSVSFNEKLFASYVETIRASLKQNAIAEKLALGESIAATYSRREVLDALPSDESDSSDKELALLESALTEALGALCKMREAEGAVLEKELLSLLGLLEQEISAIAEESKRTPIVFKERLEQRLEKFGAASNVLEPERLAQEVVLLADRIDVTEELSRLESHFEQFRSVLGSVQSGRKLEFLLQEFGREVNTIGSKAQSADITTRVVESKAILEKIREQVQNIE